MLSRIQISRCHHDANGLPYFPNDSELESFKASKYPSTNMKVSFDNSKVGQEVILTSASYPDAKNNPRYNGVHGKVVGKIISLGDKFPLWISVKWGNGYENSYAKDAGDLEFAPVATPVVAAPSVTITPTAVITTPVAPALVKPVAISLATAVENVVNQFVNKRQAFSAYDITSTLRRQVNEGFTAIENRATENVSGLQTQRINHDEVRSLVRSVANNVGSYQSRMNSTYLLWEPLPVAAVATASKPSGPTVTITPTTTVATITYPLSQIAKPLVAYISRNGPRTLKQIQSRFKVENGPQLTVSQLADEATKAGLRIDKKTTFHASVVTQ